MRCGPLLLLRPAGARDRGGSRFPSPSARARGKIGPRCAQTAPRANDAVGTPFDRTPYISLRSFKRDGRPVDTPVWCAPLDGKLVIFTLRESYKVKRIARNPRVQVAACGARGELRGPWHDGSGRLVEDAEQQARAYAALRAKYGWAMRVGDVLSSLAGRRKRRVVMEITVGTEAVAP